MTMARTLAITGMVLWLAGIVLLAVYGFLK